MTNSTSSWTGKRRTIVASLRAVAAAMGGEGRCSLQKDDAAPRLPPRSRRSSRRVTLSSHLGRSRCISLPDTLPFLSLLTNHFRPITYSCIDSSASYPHCSSRPVQALVTSGCCRPSTSSTFRDPQNSFRSIYQHPQIFVSDHNSQGCAISAPDSLHSTCGLPASPSASLQRCYLPLSRSPLPRPSSQAIHEERSTSPRSRTTPACPMAPSSSAPPRTATACMCKSTSATCLPREGHSVSSIPAPFQRIHKEADSSWELKCTISTSTPSTPPVTAPPPALI